jgi:hypothetical protein
VIELVRQLVGLAQEIDRLAHRPVLGCHHGLALHQAPGGVFRIGHRLFDRHPVGILQRPEDHFLLRRIQVLQDIDHVVGLKVAHRLGHHLARQKPRSPPRGSPRRSPTGSRRRSRATTASPAPPSAADLFQQVGDVGGVQRLHQRVDRRRVARFDRRQNGVDPGLVQNLFVASARSSAMTHPVRCRLRPIAATLAKRVSGKQGRRANLPPREMRLVSLGKRGDLDDRSASGPGAAL